MQHLVVGQQADADGAEEQQAKELEAGVGHQAEHPEDGAASSAQPIVIHCFSSCIAIAAATKPSAIAEKSAR